MLSVMAFHLASESPFGSIIEQAEIAPALTSGVEGWSFSSSMAKIELNGSPVASAPMSLRIPAGVCWIIARMAVGTFDTDSMPNL